MFGYTQVKREGITHHPVMKLYVEISLGEGVGKEKEEAITQEQETQPRRAASVFKRQNNSVPVGAKLNVALDEGILGASTSPFKPRRPWLAPGRHYIGPRRPGLSPRRP